MEITPKAPIESIFLNVVEQFCIKRMRAESTAHHHDCLLARVMATFVLMYIYQKLTTFVVTSRPAKW